MAETVEKGHGRVETRKMETTTILTLGGKWAGLAQGFRITRTRTVNGVTTAEMHYGITSLTEKEADAGRLLELVRGHWGIENGLHWIRDVVLGEDKCRVRKGDAPQVLAAMRNLVVHLLSDKAFVEQGFGRAAAMRHLGANLARPLQIIDLPPFE